MNALIIILTVIVSILGIIISIHTIIDTRRKYYNDYKKRKRNEKA